jgi:hypothetical protein
MGLPQDRSAASQATTGIQTPDDEPFWRALAVATVGFV